MIKRKILDIIPPKETKERVPRDLEPREQKIPTRKSVKKIVSLFVGISLVSVLISGYIFIEPKAEIEIWPVTDLVEFNTQAVVAVSPKTEGAIPGEIITAERTVSQEFLAKGTKLKTAKASGIIRVYNNYSTSPQPLVATTRFVSADGKLFRTPNRIVVPGTPGSIDIEVVADQPGPEYNIGPTTFSIPGLAGTAKYTAFYAKSFEPMRGGERKEVPEVTQDDLDNAREILTKKALQESKQDLESKISSGEFIIIGDATSQRIIEFTSPAKKGEEHEKFFAEVRAEAKTLAFRKADLESFSKAYVLSQIPQEKGLQDDSLQIKYFPQKIDLESGKITLGIEIAAKIYSKIEEQSLKEMIKNKKPDEVTKLLQGFPEIKKTRIEIWPFWMRSAPGDSGRIDVKIMVGAGVD